MNNIDFVELAEQCTAQYQRHLENTRKGKYDGSYYYSISEDNVIKHSLTPHILKDAYCALIIHSKTFVPVSIRYYNYSVDFIGSEGQATHGDFDDKFGVSINRGRNESFQVFELFYEGQKVYQDDSGNWDKIVPEVWEMYQMAKDCQNMKEAKMICDLISKDYEIAKLKEKLKEHEVSELYLERELSEYKSLLDEIKQLVGKE